MRHTLVTLAALASFALARQASALIIVDYGLDAANATLSITSPTAVSIPLLTRELQLESVARFSWNHVPDSSESAFPWSRVTRDAQQLRE